MARQQKAIRCSIIAASGATSSASPPIGMFTSKVVVARNANTGFCARRNCPLRPDYVLILPWNLREEIIAQLAHIGDWGGQFIIPVPEPVVLEAGQAGVRPRAAS